jgi:uncharacterized SAM-binding protein YcdF (DUF218 family)
LTKSRIIFFVTLTALMVFYIGGCRRAGVWLVREDVPKHADAMVILMGNFPERVLQAVDLWKERKADRIIIVEESMGPFQVLEQRGARIVGSTEQAASSLVAMGVPADSITILPGDARSTLDEARAVRRYIAYKWPADTLLLVSSAAHMRRASMIFKAAFNHSASPVYIGSSPSAYSNFDPKHWWRDKEGIQYVLTEYLKIGSFVLFEKKKLKN